MRESRTAMPVSSAIRERMQEISVTSEFRNGHAVREFVRAAAEACRLTADETGDLLLAVTEVFNNAVEHAHHFEARMPILVATECLGEAVEICITDEGDGFTAPTPRPLDSALATHRGLGLLLVSELVDEVSYIPNHGTTVRLLKKRGRMNAPEPGACSQPV